MPHVPDWRAVLQHLRFVMLGAILLLALGYGITVLFASPEVEWSGGDPTGIEVGTDTLQLARKSLGMSYLLTQNPPLRAGSIRRRVRSIQKVPGHCRSRNMHVPNPPLVDHVVAIDLYTVFAIPFAIIYVECGGSGTISYEPPPGFRE